MKVVKNSAFAIDYFAALTILTSSALCGGVENDDWR